MKSAKTPIGDSIAKVEALSGDGTGELIGKVQGAFETRMNEAHGTPGTEYYVHTPQSVFLDVLEQVRNLVLDWAIGLEKNGILGEGIRASAWKKSKRPHRRHLRLTLGPFGSLTPRRY
ncbi:MAG: hypothetical protein KAY22_14330 [Rhizorhabdus sp.]|uniref:AbiTii domain-containing protein n=1 Tax=Rhizorhabdus sp. TaxID=1968843 RepID=UPI001B605D9A|nr:hypothetical protein [Rhizorhabdus sp.]